MNKTEYHKESFYLTTLIIAAFYILILQTGYDDRVDDYNELILLSEEEGCLFITDTSVITSFWQPSFNITENEIWAVD